MTDSSGGVSCAICGDSIWVSLEREYWKSGHESMKRFTESHRRKHELEMVEVQERAREMWALAKEMRAFS